jgi:hypothetical protein
MKDIECPLCGGSGEIQTDERDSDGNIAHGTETETCPCRINNEDEDNT